MPLLTRRHAAAALLAIASPLSLRAQAPADWRLSKETDWPEFAKRFDEVGSSGALVVLDALRGGKLVANPERAQIGFIPGSTFKIPNTMLALHLGAVKGLEETFKWNGERFLVEGEPFLPAACNADIALRDAFRNSCIPVYQELSRRIGSEAYKDWLVKLDYGNAEIGGLLERFQAVEAAHGGRLPARLNQKPHLLFTWLDALIRHPRILDPVEDLLGPDLLCWGAQFFAKDPGDPSYVSWHQDGTYWGLSSPDVVTAWVAFTPSTLESGCMQVVPGTQARQVAHVDTFAKENLLSRGQEIAVSVRDDEKVAVQLAPGQMSLHHVLLFHGSEPNRATHRRIGLAIRYVPTHVHQASGARDWATLVRGQDRHGHFQLEQAPRADLDEAARAHHAAVLENQLKILYAGAREAGKLGAIVQTGGQAS